LIGLSLLVAKIQTGSVIRKCKTIIGMNNCRFLSYW